MTPEPSNESLASDLRLAIQRAIGMAEEADGPAEARDWMSVAAIGLQNLPYVEKS